MVHEGSNSQPIKLCISQTFRPLLFMSIVIINLYLMCTLAFVPCCVKYWSYSSVWYTLQSPSWGRMMQKEKIMWCIILHWHWLWRC